MHVNVTEVILRDGLQDEPVVVSTADKLRIAAALTDAGFRSVEATSFVNPNKLPQMADAEGFLAALPRDVGTRYSALTLNPRGVDRAARTNVDVINLVVSASNAHSIANTGRTTQQAIIEARESVSRHPELSFIASISTAFTFPAEGLISAQRVIDLVSDLYSIGLREIQLADTMGDAEPQQIMTTVAAVREVFQDLELALHLHDGKGQAMQTVDLALAAGIHRFDSALGGYGGCPYAPGAHGNIATEVLVRHLHESGHDTGISMTALYSALTILDQSLRRGVPAN